MADAENKEPVLAVSRGSGANGFDVGDDITHTDCALYQGKEEGEPENDPQFEPVVRLEQQIETKTHEENEEISFKM